MFSGAVREQRWGSSLSWVLGEVISLHMPRLAWLVSAEEVVPCRCQKPDPARRHWARVEEQELCHIGPLAVLAIAREAREVNPR